MGEINSGLVPIIVKPIGVIHSPHINSTQTPIQPVFASGIEGTVEVLPEYAEGLKDIEGFSHIHLFYHFHKSSVERLTVIPFLEDAEHGVFATRSPNRPNRIGISLVRLLRRKGNVLFVEDVDILDGAPLLDIKPFVSRFDVRNDVACGWQDRISDDEAVKKGRRAFRR